MRQITIGIADAHADRVTAFEHRILTILEAAKANRTALNTRLIALKAFDYEPPIGAIVATRIALRQLEWQRIIRRVVQGEGPGQSIWALRTIFISESADGKRRAFFSC
jgi:hypothetical protein